MFPAGMIIETLKLAFVKSDLMINLILKEAFFMHDIARLS